MGGCPRLCLQTVQRMSQMCTRRAWRNVHRRIRPIRDENAPKRRAIMHRRCWILRTISLRVRRHVATVDVFNNDYHDFWSTTDWMNNKENVCVPRGGGSADPQCCGALDSFSVIYNANNHQCCDGEVKGIGEC